MKYKTFYTFELLTTRASTETVAVTANCNAITFRAMPIMGEAGPARPAEPPRPWELATEAPQVQGIPLMPAVLPRLIQAETSFEVPSAVTVLAAADTLTFDAGHPDAVDGTIYQVRLTPRIRLMVIRRFTQPA